MSWRYRRHFQSQGQFADYEKMLEYIQRYYFDDIKLADIAKAADIGERECLRCFQKTIQLSPIQYVLKYRIIRGAEMLLHNPENSISEIATACGFESPSNFSKIFKRVFISVRRESIGKKEIFCLRWNKTSFSHFGIYNFFFPALFRPEADSRHAFGVMPLIRLNSRVK